MNTLSALLIGGDEAIEKRNMIWNMIGSFLYALASMVLSIAVVQIAGEDEGGIFAFGYSTFGQHMFMVAYFGMRPFQITDTGRRYTFGEYVRLRKMTCLTAVVFGFCYVFLFRRDAYSAHKATAVFLLVLYKVIDGYADTYEAEFQRDGRLYLTGKSNAFRTLLSVGVFLAVLSASGRLLPAAAAAVGAQVLGLGLFCLPVIRHVPAVNGEPGVFRPAADWEVRPGRCSALFRENIVLFLSVILDFYIFSAAKYAIDANMADKYQAVFAAIFMPTSVINLVAGFVIRPYITRLALEWEKKEKTDFKRTVLFLAAVIFGLTVLALGGAALLGIPVLSALYGNLAYMLKDLTLPLLLIILGGAFNAYINLFYYTLVIMDKKRMIFAGYAGTALLAFLISPAAVKRAGVPGGAFSYMILMAVLAGCFGLLTLFFYRKRR